MYADDYKELETTINNDLYKVNEYFDTHKLNLNVPKCESMLVETYQSLAKVLDSLVKGYGMIFQIILYFVHLYLVLKMPCTSI